MNGCDFCVDLNSYNLLQATGSTAKAEAVALTAWIAFQNMSAKFNSALGAEDNALCRRPAKG